MLKVLLFTVLCIFTADILAVQSTDNKPPETFSDCLIYCNKPCATVAAPGGGSGKVSDKKPTVENTDSAAAIKKKAENTPNLKNDETCKQCIADCGLYCPTDPKTGVGTCHWKTLVKANY